MKQLKNTFLILAILFSGFAVQAQEDDSRPASFDLREANNPLSEKSTINFHTNYLLKITGLGDDVANIGMFRYQQPYLDGRLLFRVSLPMNTFPQGGDTYKSGLGDGDIRFTYSFIKNEKVTAAIGPSMYFPTATNDALGAGKFVGGGNFTIFLGGDRVQWGTSLDYQHAFASKSGDGGRANIHRLMAQPTLYVHMGRGLYFRSSGMWQYNLENGDYNMPMGAGFGKILKAKGWVFNAFLEPQISFLNEGAGQGLFQLHGGLTVQFNCNCGNKDGGSKEKGGKKIDLE